MKNICSLMMLSISVTALLCPNRVFGQLQFQIEYSPALAEPLVIETLEDGYLAAGSSNSNTAGGTDGFLMSLSLEGTPVWSKVIGGPMNDQFKALKKMNNGNFIVVGSTSSFVSSAQDPSNIYLVEIDVSGTLIRSKSIGTSNYDVANSVMQTSDNGFIIAGTTTNPAVPGQSRAYLIKLDSNLDIQWSKIYGNSSQEFSNAKAVIQTADGGFAFTGHSNLITEHDNYYMFVVKTDFAGAVQFSNHYCFTDSVNYSLRGAFGYDIIQNTAGNLVIVGGVGGFYIDASSDIYQSLLMEISPAGIIVHSKSFFLNTGDCRSMSVQQTPDGGYILGGYMGNFYLSMIKTDSAITTEWCYHYDENYSPWGRGYCARNTSDGGFILSGSLISGSSFRIVKTDSDGISGCAQAIPIGPGGQSGDINLATLNLPWTLAEVGDTVSANTLSAVVNMSTNIICSQVSADSPEISTEFMLYPNPATTKLTINGRGKSGIIVMNSVGAVMIEEPLWLNGETEVDISKLPDGIYFLQAGNMVSKFIKMGL